MRLMFVDDEERVLQGVARSLFAVGVTWDVAFVTGAEQALVELETKPADAVITDLRMPVIDGGELLRRVRERWPQTFRVLLCGNDDRAALLSAGDVHQFLAKPCDGIAIINVIERLLSLRALLQEQALHDIIARAGDMPPRPRAYEELSRCIANAETGHETVSTVLERHPSLRSKILQLARLPEFGQGSAVVDAATPSFGIEPARLSLAVLLVELFANEQQQVSTDALLRRALFSALLGERIGAAKPFQRDGATAASLCETGLLIPAIEAHCRRADLRGEGSYTHVEAGAFLLDAWELPNPVVEAVAFQREPWRVHPRVFGAAGVAYVTACLVRDSEPSREYLSRCGVLGELASWKQFAGNLREPERLLI